MNSELKACTRCKRFKSTTEFYKQGQRYESLCKECKKNSRKQKNSSEKKDLLTDKSSSTNKSSECDRVIKMDYEQMPEYDTSIFYPTKSIQELGLNDDDISDLVCFFRWQMEQSKKHLIDSTNTTKQGENNE